MLLHAQRRPQLLMQPRSHSPIIAPSPELHGLLRETANDRLAEIGNDIDEGEITRFELYVFVE